jgi:hypothetical protein
MEKMGFKLSEYIHGPRYRDELDERRSIPEINGRFSVSFGRFGFLSQKTGNDENFHTLIPIHGGTWVSDSAQTA